MQARHHPRVDGLTQPVTAENLLSLVETKIGDETIWNETLVARIRLKSMIAKLTRAGTTYTAGAKVSYNGHNYHAKWWTLNEVPMSDDPLNFEEHRRRR